MKRKTNKIFPNFIAIGPGKSGTSWIYNILKDHPEVYVSTAKETVFFKDYYHKGFDWYGKFFRKGKGYKAIGEVSNTYIFSKEAAKRIYEFNPYVKLISSLRNPIDRAFSHYLFALRNAEIEDSFEEIIESRPHILQKGLYTDHLSEYFKYFSRESILLLLFDDLKKDPIEFARKIYRFLDVDSDFSPKKVSKKVLKASRPRNKFIAINVKLLANFTRKLGFPEIITKVKNNSYITKSLYSPYSDSEYPTMKKKTREKLKDYFYDDVCRLGKIIDRDLVSLWLS